MPYGSHQRKHSLTRAWVFSQARRAFWDAAPAFVLASVVNLLAWNISGGLAAGKTMTKSAEAADRREELRKGRLAEQLRANLQRRKRQTRSRRDGEPDQRDEGIAAAETDKKD